MQVQDSRLGSPCPRQLARPGLHLPLVDKIVEARENLVWSTRPVFV
jgi:hypothetical protein